VLDASEVTSSAYVCNSTVHVSGWGNASVFETDNAWFAFDPDIAVDGSGNAVAVWSQTDGTRQTVWANRFVPGTGWGTPSLIQSDNTGSAFGPDVAVDGSGNAVAIWSQSDGVRQNIWANQFLQGTGWGTATLIETDNAGDAHEPGIAMDRSGNAVAVWNQSDGTRVNIWANRFVPGTGWDAPALIETENTGNANQPEIAVDDSGHAVAVWYLYDGTRSHIWANQFSPGTGWGTANLIEIDSTGSPLVYPPKVAVNSSGNAVAVWTQYDGTRVISWANRYVPGVGWGTAAPIETDQAGGANALSIAMDGSGNAVAVWSQTDETRENIWANRFIPGTGWGTATLLETDNAGDAHDPKIAVDGSGNAIAVWSQSDGTRSNIWANRFVPGAGWGTATLIEFDDSGSAFRPDVVVDGSGNAIAVWTLADQTRYIIWFNHFLAP
jgi:hypothetical protein